MIIRKITDSAEESGTVTVCVGEESGSACEYLTLTLGEYRRICESASPRINEKSEIDEETYDRLKEGSEYTKALRSAMSSLTLSDKSTHDMKKRLAAKGYGEKAVGRAVALLVKKGYLDDNAAAKRAAYSLLGTKHYGRNRIAQYLLSHGFEREAVRSAVDAITDEEYADALDTLIERRFGDLSEISAPELRRVTSALMRLGYTTDEIKRKIRGR